MDDKELREQIAHLQAELERRSFEKRRNGGTGGVATAVPVPPPPPLKAALKTCPVCLSPRPDRGPCPGCSFEPVQGLGKPSSKPEEPAVLDTLRGFFVRGLALVREQGFERFLGERLFAYVGMVLVVLGGAFFLKYAALHSGPWGRVAVGTLAGAGAAAAGEFLSRRSRLKALSVPVTAGGWALLLYTAYAAHAVPASKVIADPRLALVLLAAAAGGMIVHALSARSRLLTAFAFAVSYFAFAATDFGPQTLGVTTVLALAGAWLTRTQRQPELVPIGLVGFAVNYWPTLERSFGVHGADPGQAAVSIAAAAGVYGATALAARPEDMDPREGAWVDASLAFGALLLAAAVHTQGGSFLGAVGGVYGLMVAALLAFLAGRRNGGEDSGAAVLQTFLAAGLAALSCWRMPTVAGQLWAFALVAGSLGLSGVALRRDAFERYALALSGLAGLTWLLRRPTDSLAAAAALAALGALGYASAWGGAPERGAATRRLWLHGGLLALAAAVSEAGFDPLMRLPAACLAALALLVLGRRRGALGADLRVQAYGLAAAAPVIGAATYLWPGSHLPLTAADALRYGASSLVLLAPLALGGWAKTADEAVEERAAGHVFAALSVAMTSLFVVREASGPALTLWWTALGGGYLLAGLLAERRELRWPALALLGLCVAKAFFHDLTGLALPWRMLSMTALGLLLVLCSLAYVRWVKEEPSVLSLPEGGGEGAALRGGR